MNFLFFDVESNGLPVDRTNKTPMTVVENWPRVIEIAWLLADNEGNPVNQNVRLIKPDCWEIPKEKFWIEHGFDTDKSKKEGIPIRQALTEFTTDLAQADFLIAHNIAFDHPVVGAEMIRYEMKGKRVPKICTMQTTIEFCAVPFAGQRNYLSKTEKRYKFPKLSELHIKLFGKDFDDKHSALGDVTALKNCFFELLKRGIIILEQPIVGP